MRIYRYVNFCNPQTKEKIRVTEKEWMNNRDKVITDNIVNNMTLEEMWERILEYVVNYTTTENIFNYNSEIRVMYVYENHTGFRTFTEEMTKLRQESKLREDGAGDEFYKLVLNGFYRYDCSKFS
jgi:hypothetical protein